MTNTTEVKLCGRCKVNPRKHQNTGNGKGGNTYCGECLAAWVREDRKKNPGKYSAAHRKHLLRARYGLSVEDYKRMLNEQGGVCKCCGKPPAENKNLVVDHDHSCCSGRRTCGKCVRALLCHDCNLLVGRVESGQLVKIYEYLGGAE